MATASTTRLPSVFISISNEAAQQQSTTQTYRHLFIGNKVTAGNAEYNTTYLVSDLTSAETLVGKGSSTYAYASQYLARNTGIPLHVVVVNDTTNTAATAEVEFGGTPEEGNFHFYIGGKKTTIVLPASPGLDSIAGRLILAINANTDLEVTAAAVGGNDNAVALTCKTKGTHGNEIKVYINAGGEDENENVTMTANQLTGGANVDTNLQAALDSISVDTQYRTWSSCFTDNASVALLKTELESRFEPTETTEAQFIAGIQGTAAELNTKGNVPNSQLITYMPMDVLNIDLPWVFTGSANADIIRSASEDAALPFTGIEVKNLTYRQDGAVESYSRNARNQFLYNGVSSYSIVAGTYRIARLITTYRVNAQNEADTSYLDLNIFFVNAYIRADLRSLMSTYLNKKLADDGVRLTTQTNFVTPSIIRAGIVGRANNWFNLGYIEDLDNFVETLSVVRNTNDRSRVDINVYPNQVNQFRIGNTVTRFIV